MGKKVKWIFSLVLILTSIKITAQQRDFGDVSRTELEMEVYHKDSTADAVVLFDVGRVEVDEKLEVRFKRHVRIKVLTDNGLSSGDISIRYRDDNPEQDIIKVRAESYYLDDKGELKKSKLGRRDKFENELSDTWKEVKFTIPGLRKGAIFDYSYEMESESPIDVPTWYFQREYPTIWSEFEVQIPEWFSYLIYTRGYNSFTINDAKLYNDVAFFRGGARLDYQGTRYHYLIKDLPAIKDEPFMKAKVNYLSQIRFQLSSYQFPYELRENVLNTWPRLVEAINDSKNYGERLKSYSRLKNEALNATNNKQTDLDKLIAVYDYVSSNMNWNNKYGLYIDKDIDDIFDEGTGNGSEINLILTQMLRESGISADPVVISTRNNGEIIDIYPIDDQFNHTIVRATIDGNSYLLDATNEKRPYNLLPVSSLNGKGLVIKSNQQVEWVDLKNDPNNSIRSLINISIKEDGTLNGTIQSNNEGFFALMLREGFSENETNEQIKDLIFDEKDEISVDSFSIRKDERNVQFGYQIDYTQNLESTKNEIYINPMTIEAIKENPFKLSERKYPVDFEFIQNKNVTVSYFLPQGWKVDDMPESKAIGMNDGSIIYRRLIQATENTISLRYDFVLKKTQFFSEQYLEIKNVYESIVKENSQMIVLKRIEE